VGVGVGSGVGVDDPLPEPPQAEDGVPPYSYAPMSYADPAGQALPSKSQGISDNETPALMAGEEG
jgi:hypothetical protein